MSSGNQSPEQNEPKPEAVLDKVKYEHFMRQVRNDQSLALGAGAGIVAAVVGAALWAGITYATGWQAGIIAVGIGFLVGYAVRSFGRGVDRSFGIIGAVLALGGCLAGNLLVACVSIAEYQDVGLGSVIGTLDLELIVGIMKETFHPMDLLFYGIAVYEGYKLSFRQLTEDELRGVMRPA